MSLNHEQLLFLVYGEEASEVAKEASKCIRFTPTHTHVDFVDSNYQRLLKEWNEQLAMMSLIKKHMREEYGIESDAAQERIWQRNKIKQFEKYAKISGEMGTYTKGQSK
jgi:hypothetical protein